MHFFLILANSSAADSIQTFPILAMLVNLFVKANPLDNSGRELFRERLCDIILNFDQLFRRRCCLKDFYF